MISKKIMISTALVLTAIISSTILFSSFSVMTEKTSNDMLNSLPMPPIFSFGGESVSLEEAMQLANNTEFKLEFPTNIPLGLTLTDIRVTGVGPASPKSSTPTLGTVILIYSKAPLPKDADLKYLLDSGGLSVLENKLPANFNQRVNSYQGKDGPDEPAIGVTVDGKPAIYGRGDGSLPWTTQLKWSDGELKIHIEAGPEHFTQEELISFAASFK